NGIGALSSATMKPGAAADEIAVAYEYNGGYGRPSKEGTTVGSGGPVYSIDTEWDSFDRVETQRYPLVGTRRLSVHFDYDATGTLTGLSDVSNGASYWHLTQQDASGAVLGEEFGNGIATRRNFDRQKRLKFVETTSGTGPAAPLLQRLAYQYEGGLLK